jgi:hypothetical protein
VFNRAIAGLAFVRLFQACVLLLCLTHRGSSQVAVDHWTTDNGLPLNSVTAICQTPEGYLWLATFDGLVRYDGFQFTTFNKSNTKGIQGNRFGSIFCTADGGFWAGADGSGVTRYDQGRFKTYTVRNGLPSDGVWGLSGDTGDGIWVLAAGRLARWEPSGQRFVPLPQKQYSYTGALSFDGRGAFYRKLVQQNEVALYTKAVQNAQLFFSDPCTFTLDADIASTYSLHYDGHPFCGGQQSAIFGAPVRAASYFTAYGFKYSYAAAAQTVPYFGSMMADTSISYGEQAAIALSAGSVVAAVVGAAIFANLSAALAAFSTAAALSGPGSIATVSGLTPVTTDLRACASYVSDHITLKDADVNLATVKLSVLTPVVGGSATLAFGPGIPSTQAITLLGNPTPAVCVSNGSLTADFTLNVPNCETGTAPTTGKFQIQFNGNASAATATYALTLSATNSACTTSIPVLSMSARNWPSSRRPHYLALRGFR